MRPNAAFKRCQGRCGSSRLVAVLSSLGAAACILTAGFQKKDGSEAAGRPQFDGAARVRMLKPEMRVTDQSKVTIMAVRPSTCGGCHYAPSLRHAAIVCSRKTNFVSGQCIRVSMVGNASKVFDRCGWRLNWRSLPMNQRRRRCRAEEALISAQTTRLRALRRLLGHVRRFFGAPLMSRSVRFVMLSLLAVE
jgi:hypothetical protein